MKYSSPASMNSILIKDALLSDDRGKVARGWLLLSDGKITGLAFGHTPTSLCADRVIDGAGKVILPGFTNGHTHLSQTLMGGLTDGLDLSRALKQIIWPFESNMSTEDIRLATLLGLVENLRSGVTTIVEHNKTPRPARNLDAVAECAARVGMRMCLVRGWADLGTAGETIDDILGSAEDLYETFKSGLSDLVSVGLGPLACGRCSENSIRRLSGWARSRGIPTHTHVAETENEVRRHKRRTGRTPVEWLHSLGALGTEAQLVHCVWVSDRDLDLIAESGATVVHCPVSNSYLGAGIAPINEMLKRGIPIKLGTDGAATNESQNLLESLRHCLLLARTATKNPKSLGPIEALRMVYNDHRVMGHPAALAVGAPADVALFPSRGPKGIAATDQSIMLNAAAHAHTVIVNGKVVLDSGTFVGIDEVALREECQKTSTRLLERLGIGRKRSSMRTPAGTLLAEKGVL